MKEKPTLENIFELLLNVEERTTKVENGFNKLLEILGYKVK